MQNYRPGNSYKPNNNYKPRPYNPNYKNSGGYNRYNNNRDRKFINYDGYTINEAIKSEEVRVIMGTQNLGVLKTSEALAKAKENEMDLILIAEQAKPPVAKIMEFAKFKYQEQQKKQKAKAGSKQQDLKEFRLSVSIGKGDFDTRINRAIKFLKNKDKVKFVVEFKGRENAYRDLGYAKLQQVTELLSSVGKPEDLAPKLMGNKLVLSYTPKTKLDLAPKQG